MLFSFLLQDNDYSKLKIATTVRKPLILTKNAVICGLLADNFLNCTRQAYKEKLPNMWINIEIKKKFSSIFKNFSSRPDWRLF